MPSQLQMSSRRPKEDPVLVVLRYDKKKSMKVPDMREQQSDQ